MLDNVLVSVFVITCSSGNWKVWKTFFYGSLGMTAKPLCKDLCVCVCVCGFVNQANSNLKIPPQFRGTGTGRTPNFSVVFHIFPRFFSYLVMASHHTTQEPSHYSRVNSCLLVLTSASTGNLPVPVPIHRKRVT